MTDVVDRLLAQAPDNAAIQDAAAEIKKLRGLLAAAKEEHYCGLKSDCGSPFCKAMRAAGEPDNG